MLQQILKDLWVDPELLDRLDDDQKQQLFCRMREEQVRRWKIWDEEQALLEKEGRRPPPPRKNPKKDKKKVQFLTSTDGDPWVWVMGEHKDDKTIEQILEEEARQKAIQQAKREAEELRKTIEAELLIDEESWKSAPDNNKKCSNNRANAKALDIYNSADEIKESLNFKKSSPNNMISHTKNIITHFQPDKSRDILQELKLNTKKPNQGVAMRVAQWENRLEERSTQIFQTLQKKKEELKQEAEKVDEKQEEVWREQERRAKEAEQQIREIARRAREEHRRTSVLMDTTPPPSPERRVPPPINFPKPSVDANTSNYSIPSTESSTDLRPPNKEAIYEWFQKTEVQRKAGIDPSTNKLAAWFHGLITRQDAETLLKNEQVGSFVVRVSEKIWGYAISLKEEERCKHYLVDSTNGHYQFPGTNQIEHKTLGDLVSYHSWEPITANGKEILRKPCAWLKPPEIFSKLIPVHQP